MKSLRPLLSALALTLTAAACTRQDASSLATCAPAATWSEREIVIPAGEVDISHGAFWPEEQALGRLRVGAFAIDATEVTNAQFRSFVEATGYVTTAERRTKGGVRNGAAVFDRRIHQWRLDPLADWRHPDGKKSSIRGRDRNPVVQVSFEDAMAYARWKGRRLPTEAQWERAARLAAPASIAREAEAFDGVGKPTANTWQGAFPVYDAAVDGFAGTAPVACFPPNAQGLYDMIGNVWEWTSDWYTPGSEEMSEAVSRARDPDGVAKRVIKGGSHLCSPNFCARYRSRARQGGDPGIGASHIGLRTVREL